MRKTIFIASILIAANSIATSVQVQYQVLTTENAASFGVKVFNIPEPIFCKSEAEIWITAPELAKRATFHVINDSNEIVISGALEIQNNVAEPIFAQGATYTDGSVDEELKKYQANYGFLSNGFRGVRLCLRAEYLSKLTIQFDDRYPNDLITKVWHLGLLSKWLK